MEAISDRGWLGFYYNWISYNGYTESDLPDDVIFVEKEDLDPVIQFPWAAA